MILVRLLVAASLSTAPPTGFGTQYDDDWPPQEYQRVGTLPVTFVPNQESLNKLCGDLTDKTFQVKGCSLRGKHHIVLEDPCQPQYRYEVYARRVCHELAHALGNWPGNHPGPRGGGIVQSAEPSN